LNNHPSGNALASEADKILTKKLVEGGKVLEISVLDHVIVTKHSYASMADDGLIT
jgi:DNA repair protein RadC